jgi:pimeloyl-ACP methyl ester carboxylesterase
VPLVFVHGFPLSRGAWQKQIDALRSSLRVIAPDLPGCGESDALLVAVIALVITFVLAAYLNRQRSAVGG